MVFITVVATLDVPTVDLRVINDGPGPLRVEAPYQLRVANYDHYFGI